MSAINVAAQGTGPSIALMVPVVNVVVVVEDAARVEDEVRIQSSTLGTQHRMITTITWR